MAWQANLPIDLSPGKYYIFLSDAQGILAGPITIEE
jgi:hypothetical protein